MKDAMKIQQNRIANVMDTGITNMSKGMQLEMDYAKRLGKVIAAEMKLFSMIKIISRYKKMIHLAIIKIPQ